MKLCLFHIKDTWGEDIELGKFVAIRNKKNIAECYKSVGGQKADIINTLRDTFGLSE